MKSHYKFSEFFGKVLLDSMVVIMPGKFSNGDCYEHVITKLYRNYSSACSQGNPAFGIQAPSESTAAARQLRLYPNPASQRVQVDIPSSESEAVLQLLNLNGEVLIHRQIGAGVNVYQLDVSELPLGMYVVNCVQGSAHYSVKFVKQ